LANVQIDFFKNLFWINEKWFYICTRNSKGALAQLVEQWTENPCVPGSIPGGTTKTHSNEWVFCFKPLILLMFTIFKQKRLPLNIKPFSTIFLPNFYLFY
jgi:hypothetical protein